MKRNKIILTAMASIFFSTGAFAYCIGGVPCDASVTYAMYKQRQMIDDRMGDFDKTLTKMKEEQEDYNTLLVKEDADLIRLRERYNIRLIKMMEINHYAKKVKKQEESLAHSLLLNKKAKVPNDIEKTKKKKNK